MQLLNKLRGRSTTDLTVPIVLIVGLGNPGRQHAGNRHNIGRRIADHLVASRGWQFSKKQNDALIAFGQVDDTRAIVAKPQTFMNASGRAVQPLARFYKVPSDRLLAIYDDLDLPFGVIRLRETGGAGGHNGMRSIIERMGTSDFPRLRVGIGRPPGRMDPAAFVLRDFDANEQAGLPDVLERAAQAIETFITHGIAAAMNRYNAPGKTE
jgi:PTH1 family peptidyl-tRNA hydrolase